MERVRCRMPMFIQISSITGIVIMSYIAPFGIAVAIVLLLMRRLSAGREDGGNDGNDAHSTQSLSSSDAERSRQTIEQYLANQGLSDQERIIAIGIMSGKTHAQLASELYVARSTIGTYCRRIYEKLHVANKSEMTTLLDDVASQDKGDDLPVEHAFEWPTE